MGTKLVASIVPDRERDVFLRTATRPRAESHDAAVDNISAPAGIAYYGCDFLTQPGGRFGIAFCCRR